MIFYIRLIGNVLDTNKDSLHEFNLHIHRVIYDYDEVVNIGI